MTIERRFDRAGETRIFVWAAGGDAVDAGIAQIYRAADRLHKKAMGILAILAEGDVEALAADLAAVESVEAETLELRAWLERVRELVDEAAGLVAVDAAGPNRPETRAKARNAVSVQISRSAGDSESTVETKETGKTGETDMIEPSEQSERDRAAERRRAASRFSLWPEIRRTGVWRIETASADLVETLRADRRFRLAATNGNNRVFRFKADNRRHAEFVLAEIVRGGDETL